MGKQIVSPGVLKDIAAKADKVSGATSGNVAKLDSNGNLEDSGYTLGASVPSDAVFTDTVTEVVDNLTTDSSTKALSAAQGKALNNKITNLDGSIPYAEGDANSYTTTGIYHVGITQNSPTGVAIYGDLFVQGTGQRVTQMFTIYDGTTYVRQRINATTWNAWDAFALNSKARDIARRQYQSKYCSATAGTLEISNIPDGVYIITVVGKSQSSNKYISVYIDDASHGYDDGYAAYITPTNAGASVLTYSFSFTKAYNSGGSNTLTATYSADWYKMYVMIEKVQAWS